MIRFAPVIIIAAIIAALFATPAQSVPSASHPQRLQHSCTVIKSQDGHGHGTCFNNGIYAHGIMQGCTNDLGGTQRFVRLGVIARGQVRAHFDVPLRATHQWDIGFRFEHHVWDNSMLESGTYVDWWIAKYDPKNRHPHTWLGTVYVACICPCGKKDKIKSNYQITSRRQDAPVGN